MQNLAIKGGLHGQSQEESYGGLLKNVMNRSIKSQEYDFLLNLQKRLIDLCALDIEEIRMRFPACEALLVKQ